MVALTTFSPDDPTDVILDVVRRDGAAIIAEAMDPELHVRVARELAPWISDSPSGTDDFVGRQTARTGALVARSRACRELVTDQRIISLAEGFLAEYTTKILLHLTQAITISPGQGSQPLHRDRLAWGGHLPGSIEPQFNTIWALTDFTAENGATQVAPGSPHWEAGRRAEPDDLVQAEMAAGSVLLYTGSVIHGGGANESEQSRTGINITYCLGWLRTEENQYLSCPPDIAKGLDPDLQDLLGYTHGSYALGYYSDPESINDVSDLRPPELAVGRKPSRRPDDVMADG